MMYGLTGSRLTFTVLGVFCTLIFALIGVMNWQLGEGKSIAVHLLSVCGMGGASAINVWELLRRHQAGASH
jgi:hypothetical protein